MPTNPPHSLLELTTDLVRAYLERNNLPAAGLPDLIRQTYDSVSSLGRIPVAAAVMPVSGAVALRKSLASPDHILSMIDGKPYRTLKKHIGRHGMTPKIYRETFNLPDSYPMVAPAYSAQRSAMAKNLGLGRKSAAVTVPAPTLERKKLRIAGPKAE